MRTADRRRGLDARDRRAHGTGWERQQSQGDQLRLPSLWWDGFTIAKNISDEDAEASFIAMLNGISDDMVMANNDKAVWLIGQPTSSWQGRTR